MLARPAERIGAACAELLPVVPEDAGLAVVAGLLVDSLFVDGPGAALGAVLASAADWVEAVATFRAAFEATSTVDCGWLAGVASSVTFALVGSTNPFGVPTPFGPGSGRDDSVRTPLLVALGPAASVVRGSSRRGTENLL
ncbi:MAG: hypothetical protein JWN95_2927 [Frankiales bacterium]|nr:hypothetical protein [Frankiales bacterium]